MIPIGFAANGDILVIRIQVHGCQIGLVSHDKFWEEDCAAEEAYVEVSRTIEEFLWRSVEGLYLPTDFFAATELAELRHETIGNNFDPQQ
jgi:hypothetical protein